MSELPAFHRLSFLLLCILALTVVTSGFPQTRPPLRSLDDAEESNRDEWEVLFPSISLGDWIIQMMSAPSVGADSNARLMREAWLFALASAEASRERAWPAEWSSHGAGTVKRNMVVADDAAFREKSKLLTSMERQKWLNSYMQKLLVVKSS
ncbi:tuberoinfundibular peptide of 39 residues [Pungitius pungitius]|uniref:tuberoinfundibular peptide of 39 residues n=1 Tax=Pungitius pungitius TaxID=134920 RepID=UPI002E11B16D